MPHVIIEYVQDLARDEQLPVLIDAVHHGVLATGFFDESHIKTRTLPITYYRTGKGQEPFIHVTIRIHSGRSEEQKKQLSESVLNAMRELNWPAKVITVEVVDIDRATYAKHTSA